MAELQCSVMVAIAFNIVMLDVLSSTYMHQHAFFKQKISFLCSIGTTESKCTSRCLQMPSVSQNVPANVMYQPFIYQPFKGQVSALQSSCISPSKVLYQPFKGHVSALQSLCISPSKFMYHPFKGHISALQRSCISP